VPRGVVEFAINAGLNILATGDNLKRWRKRTSDACKVCHGLGKQTLCHVLSSCSTALKQGRYTWRHDSVLQSIVDFVKPKLREGFTLFSDLNGQDAGNGGTFPPDIIVTSQRPDLVLIDREKRLIIVFELTCPWDANINKDHTYKQNKYASLISDLKVILRWICTVLKYLLEVRSRNQTRPGSKHSS
jgi:hypothetical protein